MTWHPDIPEEYRNQIVTGDARELAKRIPDESVDLILCDPVYWEYWQYALVDETGHRALVNGGSAIVQLGQVSLPQVIEQFKLLNYATIFAERNPGATARNWQLKLNYTWKPWLWYLKGKRRINTFAWDMGQSSRAKALHTWGDGMEFVLALILQHTNPGGFVVDLFSGSGTVPAVCKILGRNYIAFEIDPDTAEMARERVLNTQPPLFVPEPEQLEIDL